jgi:hypothetical protein
LDNLFIGPDEGITWNYCMKFQRKINEIQKTHTPSYQKFPHKKLTNLPSKNQIHLNQNYGQLKWRFPNKYYI